MFAQFPAVKSLLRGIVLWAPVWIGATIVCGAIGGVYAFLLKSDTYLATQAILVRDEANATMMRLGRFESQTQLKAAQETIMEMAKNHQVVRVALQESGKDQKSWWPFADDSGTLTDRQINSFANNNVSVHAPKGVEFGNTEVIYLDVKSDSPDSALKIVDSLAKALDNRLRQVREARATSIIAELTTAKQAAQRELAATTERIQSIEKSAGSQLADLRGLTDTIGSSGGSRSQIDQIDTELRVAVKDDQQLAADLELLETALADPAAYVLAPGSVLNSQPGLRKLREGLADAQLSTSQLTGRFTDAHPLVRSARDAQSSIESKLIKQLEASKYALIQDISTSKKRIEQLSEQKQLAERRLDGLAAIRSEYANVVAELKTRSAILEETERQLAEANASQKASQSVSLLTRLDKPQVGDKPIGPGRVLITLCSALGGLLLGLGFVFAVTPIDGNHRFGRRWGDYMSQDQRRKSSVEDPNVAGSQISEETNESELPTIIENALDRHLSTSKMSISKNASKKNSATSRAADTSYQSSGLPNGISLDDATDELEGLLLGEAEYLTVEEEPSEEEFTTAPKRRSSILEELLKAKDALDGYDETELASSTSATVMLPTTATEAKAEALTETTSEAANERRQRDRTSAPPAKPLRVGVRPKRTPPGSPSH